MMEHEQWDTLSQAYAFLGNSLLAPMTQTETVGLDPRFWEQFPSFDSPSLCAAAGAMAKRADSLSLRDNPVLAVSVEHTHLFIGPPRPAAAPWETFYRGGAREGGAAVGFGEATFAMRRQLRELGLRLSNENHQYEDHMGIELLCLSTLCSRAAQGGTSESAIAAYIDERPGSWISAFLHSVAEERPKGYFAGLLSLVDALLSWHREQLDG